MPMLGQRSAPIVLLNMGNRFALTMDRPQLHPEIYVPACKLYLRQAELLRPLGTGVDALS